MSAFQAPAYHTSDWPALVSKEGDALEAQYRHTLEHLGRQHGLLGLVFRKAQNKITDPAKLRRLVADLIDREKWVMVGVDVKGDAYEGLLERNAQDTKSGAGQYFTPRPLIDAVVDCVRPQPGETVIDPACGTGGFLLAAHAFLTDPGHNPNLTREQREHLRLDALRGVEIVPGVTRLCAMNLMLHGVGPTPQELDALRAKLVKSGVAPDEADARIDARLPVRTDDALRSLGSERYQVVLTNPPFGKKSSILVVTEEGDTDREAILYERDDFWAGTTNKQLNFVQHVKSLLDIHGRAAVVVPDNVLFEGGAGETVRRALLRECDVHTLLRLPTGIFYAQGVKANVLFFDRKPASPDPWTTRLWVYDLRTNLHFTLKTKRLKRSDLDDFVACFNPRNRHDRTPTWSEATPGGRFRAYTYDEIVARDKCSLDLFWLKDESLLDADTLPEPDEIAAEIAEDLRSALTQIEEILGDLSRGSAEEPMAEPDVTVSLRSQAPTGRRFERYIGIDYSGAEAPEAGLPGLRVYAADAGTPPIEVPPPSGPKKHWTRRGLAHWLAEQLRDGPPVLVGIDHAFSFPVRYFQEYGLPHDWPAFLDDFQRHWPTDTQDTWVDDVREGKAGHGAARTGENTWRRLTERRARSAKSVFLFDVNGAVAKSTHSGLPWLRFLRQQLGDHIHFWPFDGWELPAGKSAVVEVYPRLWSAKFKASGLEGDCLDAYSVAAWLQRADADGTLAHALTPKLSADERAIAAIEGWILGVG